MVTLKKKSDTIESHNNSMLTRANTMQSFLNRVIFKMYQDAQRKRWMSQGSSEKDPWPSLNSKYADWKKKKYSAYPGGGSKMMIATNSLEDAVIERAYKVATNTGITISVNPSISNPVSKKEVSSYAKYAAHSRPFMKFSDETIGSFRKAISQYIKKGS